MPDEDIEAEQKFTIEGELDVIANFLKEVKMDVLKLSRLVQGMKDSMGKGTKDQLNEWDKVLKDYMFFQEDADVNGERVKKISKALLDKANESGVDTKEFSEKETWKFDW